MKAHKNKGLATRAAVTELSKALGLSRDEVKAQREQLFTIEDHEDGGFYWRRIQTESTAGIPKPSDIVKPELEKAMDMVDEDAKQKVDDAVKEVKKTTSAIPHLGKSTVENPCRVVFDTADSMKGATRKEVIVACIGKGVATATAKTQYQRWFTASKGETK